MARGRWFIVAGLLALGHQSAAQAFFWPRCAPAPRQYPPTVLPQQVLPPTQLPDMANPRTPVDPNNPNPPVQPPNAAIPPGTGGDTLAGNEFLGGQAAGTFTPNMFGDFFGGAGTTRTLISPNAMKFTGNGSLTLTPSHGDSPYDSASGVTNFDPRGAGAVIQLILNGYGSRSVNPAAIGTSNIVHQVVAYGLGDPIPGQTNFAVNQTTTNVFSEVVDRLSRTPQGRAILLAGLNQLTGKILTSVDSLTLGPTGTLNVHNTTTSDLIYYYQVMASGLGTVPYDLGIHVANPANGGNVGRTKISEDNSPFPRDRVFFNYDYYSATQLSANGANVNRFSAGAEMTFLDRQGSVEVRVPFASTLASSTTIGEMTSRDVQLGNVAIAAKWMWTRDPVLNFASGLSAALPTANNTTLRLSDGSELLSIQNQTVLLSPYAAMSYTPNDRLFSQSWLSVGFDAFGNQVRFRNVGDNSVQTAKIYAIPILSVDTQLGYWVARNNDASAILQGLAPFVELHYNSGMNVGRRNARFNGVNIIDDGQGFNDVNMTVGFTAQLRNNLYVSNGLVVPLGEKESRFFDWQYGLRMNWLYGPTARASEAAMDAIRARSVGEGLTPGAMPAFVPPNTFSQAETTKSDVVAVQHTEAASPSPIQQTLVDAQAIPCATCSPPPETPPFFGDFIGVSGQRTVLTPGGPQSVRVPIIPQFAGLKVTDNDGPRPMDRFYFTYNNFTGAFQNQNPGGYHGLDVNQETVGFEKTVFGGYGSIGMRLPFVQSGGPGLEDSAIGDLTIVSKLAWAQDAATGSLITSGVNLTLPTGHSGSVALLNNGGVAPRSLWLQPWTGFLFNQDRFYTQGVVSIAAPSQAEYPVEVFTSVGAGYWLVRSDTEGIRGLIPTVELHVNTPLTNRGAGRLVNTQDEANLTTGLNVLLPKMTLGGAIGVPVLGQSSYRLEALATLNFRF
ncbi:hypothetical protein [Zavarzinella formosa]|uniref:hypothetical protein n=1 Tax=Zavarzinella formosa TaxID=360055 RepID=UPI000306C2CA|nr:hypothetical protein [Zavarzinella formosa]